VFPECGNDDAINRRIALLFDICKKLDGASVEIKEDPRCSALYSAILKCRFSSIKTAYVLLHNCTNPDKELQKGVIARDTSVDNEIRKVGHRDGYTAFILLAGRCHAIANGNDEEKLKTTIRECTGFLHKPYPSSVVSKGYLEHKLHILRLQQIFSLLNVAKAARDPDGEAAYASIHEFLYAPTLPKGQSLVDQSFEHLRLEHKSDSESERFVLIWWDTLLGNCLQLDSEFKTTKHWSTKPLLDARSFQAIVAEHLTASQGVIAKLRKSGELSPDYLYPSLRLHFVASKTWDRNKDPSGFANLVKHGKEYARWWLRDDGLLHTPIRTPCEGPLNIEAKRPEIEKMRDHFDKIRLDS
jgi:hypothetical protein